MSLGRIVLVILIALCSACASKVEKQREHERTLLDRQKSYRFEDLQIKHWLQQADENRSDLEEVKNQEELYIYNDYSISCNRDLSWNCKPYDVRKIISPPDLPNRYTMEFRQYVLDYYKTLSTEYDQLAKEIASLVEKREETEAEENRLRQEREFAEINEAHEMLLTRIETEKEALSKLTKKAGYAGFTNAPIQEVLIQTRRLGGGLENFLDYVIGCVPVVENICEEQDSRFKLIQSLQNGSLYHYAGNGSKNSFTIYIENNKNRIYQEGQRLKTEHYVLKGMYSYTSALGPRSVPHFAPVVY